MQWIVYETLCLANGKRYVGVHLQAGEEFDGYLGSGTALRAAVAVHGQESFERRTLAVCGSMDEAYAREAEIVTEEWVARTDTYNCKTGGRGGYGHRHTKESRERIRNFRLGRRHTPETRELIGQRLRVVHRSPGFRARLSLAMSYANRGRVVTPETRERIAESMRRAWKEGRRRGP